MSLFLSISDKKVLDAIEEKCFIISLWEINLCSFLEAGYVMIIFQMVFKILQETSLNF